MQSLVDHGVRKPAGGGARLNRPKRRSVNWIAVIAAVLASVCSGMLVAGSGQWTGGLPEGGRVEGVAHDPLTKDVVLVSPTRNGAYRSADGARTWAPSRSGLPLEGLRLAASRDGTFLAHGTVCCSSIVLYRSSDGGSTWQDIAPVAPQSGSRSFAVDPDDSDTVYLTTDDSGAFKTTDGGATWSPINNGLPSPLPYLTVITVDPSDTQRLYLVSSGDLYSSANGGASWVSLGRALPFRGLLVDPEDPERLFGFTTSSFYRSLDGGVTWATMLGEYSVSLALDETSTNVLLAGTRTSIFRSEDGGDSWVETTPGQTLGWVHGFSFSPFDSSEIVAGSDRGPLRSEDHGFNWQLETRGLDAYPSVVGSSTVVPAPIVASSSMAPGIHRSTDKGATWTLVDERFDVDPFAPAPSDPNRFYGVTDLSVAGFFLADILRSDDGGLTWRSPILNPQDFGIIGPAVYDLAVHPIDRSTLVAANWSFDIGLSELAPAILRSTDGGARWTELYRPALSEYSYVLANGIVIDPANPGRIWVGVWRYPVVGSRHGAVLRTSDGGQTWDERLLGGDYLPYAIVIDAVNPQKLYLFAQDQTLFMGRLFETSDGGDTWNEISPPTSKIGDLVADPVLPDTLYLAGDKIWVSRDGATTWEVIEEESLPAVRSFSSLNVSATSPRVLHAGSSQGVYTNTTSVRLEAEGTCPGQVTLNISNGPVNAEAGVVAAANNNGWVKGGALCNGTQFEIGEPFRLPPLWIGTDSAGNGSAVTTLPADRCWVEAIELANCTTSDAVHVD